MFYRVKENLSNHATWWVTHARDWQTDSCPHKQISQERGNSCLLLVRRTLWARPRTILDILREVCRIAVEEMQAPGKSESFRAKGMNEIMSRATRSQGVRCFTHRRVELVKDVWLKEVGPKPRIYVQQGCGSSTAFPSHGNFGDKGWSWI